MNQEHPSHTPFHTIVIGAGSGGLTAAIGLARFGKRVALVERKHVGGDCTNVGCVPSKTLIHFAKQGSLDADEVLARVQEKRNALREEETEWVKDIDNLTFFEGTARLAGVGRLELSPKNGQTQTLSAQNIVIATGSSPVRIDIPGLSEARTLTNESLFELHNPPEHIAMVGGGIISSEMAFAFRNLGSRVTVIDRGERVLSKLEPGVSKLIRGAMAERGIEVCLESEAARYDEASRMLFIKRRGGEEAVPEVDRVLLALGRKPNVEELGLEALGVTVTEKGLPVNRYGETNVRGVYAVGDATTTSAFTHSANAQARRVVQHLAFPWLPVLRGEPHYPAAVFTDPEVATVGPSLAGLQKRMHPKLIKTVRVDLKDTDRAYTMGLERGFVILHARRLTGSLLAATIVAPDAAEMIPLLTLAVNKGMSVYTLTSLVFPYPTLSEAVKKAADEFLFDTLPNIPREAWAYARYRFASGNASRNGA